MRHSNGFASRLPCLLLPALFAFIVGCGSGKDDSENKQGGDRANSQQASGTRGTITETTSDFEPLQRNFRFQYNATITNLTPGAEARVWIPIASTRLHQQVQLAAIDVPAEYRFTTDPVHGNRMVYFVGNANESGEIPISIEYEVRRDEISAENYEPVQATTDLQIYLQASQLVPLGGKPNQTIVGDERLTGSPMEVAQTIFQRVDQHLRYDKPAGEAWGRGDAVWACDSQFGNCTDFHSLFISVCRTQEIPARFEIGFTIPTTEGAVQGYHCWAQFSHDHKWVPVDISQADSNPEKQSEYFAQMKPDRFMISIGRDIMLTPMQKGAPINFFVYPYVEVNDVPHTGLKTSFHATPSTD